MYLKSLYLQNFRSYKKREFSFSKTITLIVGPNTSGKTNLMEAIFFLSLGKSFKAEKDIETIRFGENLARIKAELGDGKSSTSLEVIIVGEPFSKKFLVNGVPKRRADFSVNLSVVLFAPSDLDIIIGSPGLRRNFLDNILEQADRGYKISLNSYSKALRQRNALLEKVQETGIRNQRDFEYWDNLIIDNGQIISKKREEFITFLNNSQKEVFDFAAEYDKSEISKERLLQYRDAEAAAGLTLVGPHRDDIRILMDPNKSESVEVRYFGSRGQQRLCVLQLKMLQIAFLEKELGQRPTLLLDDIFSELDEKHINLVLEMIRKQQTIITTTHKEFVSKGLLEKMETVELIK